MEVHGWIGIVRPPKSVKCAILVEEDNTAAPQRKDEIERIPSNLDSVLWKEERYWKDLYDTRRACCLAWHALKNDNL
jgi:hypothetical protein